MAGRSPSGIRGDRPASSPSTTSASACAPRRIRAAEDPVDQRVCVLAIGKLVEAAEKAAAILAAEGIDVSLWDVRCCAPLDEDMLADAGRHRAVVTCEDGVRDGGIGMTIEDRLGAIAPATLVEVLGTPNRFLPHDGRPERILARLGLDAEGIAATVRRLA